MWRSLSNPILLMKITVFFLSLIISFSMIPFAWSQISGKYETIGRDVVIRVLDPIPNRATDDQSSKSAITLILDEQLRQMFIAHGRGLPVELSRIRAHYDELRIFPSLSTSKIQFSHASARLRPDAYPVLASITEAILHLVSRNNAELFLVEGHTDDSGDPAVNISLSNARAAAVCRYMITIKEVPAKNLLCVGFASQFPIEGYSASSIRNRRVVLRRLTSALTVEILKTPR